MIAETKDAALKAAKAVKIEYEDLPPIVTIEVLINNSIILNTRLLEAERPSG